MPRMTRQKVLETGTLTIMIASELIQLSKATLKRILEKGEIDGAFLIPPSNREWRIPAPSLVDYCKAKNMPYDRELDAAAARFTANTRMPT